MQSVQPIVKDLVLIGGGHSHAIVLKQFGMKPLPGIRLTLITDVMHTPYSGMLPGYMAGLYRFDDCHIDLRPLCQFAQAQMVVDRAIGLDLTQNQVLFADRPPITFDIASIDIGSTPSAATIPGAKEHSIPVKPISQFLQYWEQIIAQVQADFNRPMRFAVVGGGAGGVELMLSVQTRLQQIQPTLPLEFHLFQRGNRLLPEQAASAANQLQHILIDRGVQLHLGETVTAIKASSAAKQIHCKSGLTVECDVVFWVTQAAAASWLADSGLATDDRGFIQISETLQSISHPQVFAAGDVATMVNHPRPKAGVFAVRQGKPLADNLRRALQGQALQPFIPQKQFLSLIGTGGRSAIASRGNLTIGAYPWIWQWKDRIDRRFMQKFSDLQPMTQPKESRQTEASSPQLTPSPSAPPPMHCAGCGSKVGSSILEQVLSRIEKTTDRPIRPDILIGLDAPDDAAVLTVPSGQVMVQTLDYFRALLNDPYLFGQIATNHCLSDLYAMNAAPHSALAIVSVPYGTADKLAETLYQLLSGATKILNQAEAPLIGGHTIEGAELAFGLSCNGLANPDRLWRKSGMQPGQALILTKPLGTGTLFAADMQLQAKGRWIEGAIDSMLQSNQAAAACFRDYSATACTDITGFGLLGHLVEMIRASQVAIELDLNALPVLDGAKTTAQQGFLSSLHPQNLKAAQFIQNLKQIIHHPLYPLLFDPQTSGGLLASLPIDQANLCLQALRASGYPHSRILGHITSSTSTPTILITS